MSNNAIIRIAMWSGPRNLSTAMMRSFGARGDCFCIDEPFYAAYLALTGLEHPMRAEILDKHPSDAEEVARYLADGEVPAPLFYQKHMTHHMVDGIPRGWMKSVRHAFLIRRPERVLASYAKKVEAVSLEDIGFKQQAELFARAADERGEAPVVVDSDDILADPAGVLEKLCAGLGIAFTPAMLSWAPGPKPEDGAWAPHWYDAVWKSTGFAKPNPNMPDLPVELARIAEQATPFYEQVAVCKVC